MTELNIFTHNPVDKYSILDAELISKKNLAASSSSAAEAVLDAFDFTPLVGFVGLGLCKIMFSELFNNLYNIVI